ncbi:MAG: hypothetical protein ACK5C3_01355 [bacterium]
MDASSSRLKEPASRGAAALDVAACVEDCSDGTAAKTGWTGPTQTTPANIEALAATVARTRNGMEGRLLDASDMMNLILSSSDPPSPIVQIGTGARNAGLFNASATERRQLP